MTGGGLRDCVLVVDDDRRSRGVVLGALESRYRVREAANAEEALAIVASGSVDLVLLDVMMPGTSGFDVCRRIKAGDGPYLPVLLLTALSNQESRNNGLEAGADDFLTKPIDIRELRLRVATFLRIRQQDRLIRQQVEDLREMHQMREDMVALFTHDLRNPLGGVLGFLSVLREEVSAEQVDHVDAALDAGRRLRDGLEDLLHSRRLEERGTLERTPTRLAEVLSAARTSVAGAAAIRGVTLDDRGAGDVVVDIDRKLVVRAVENLLANAIKYTRRGGVVSVDVVVDPTAVALTVTDQGVGVPEALKATLFAKYSSVEAATGAARRGFGYGLYLVRLVADAHGGSISVHDGPAGGAAFRLSLPRRST